ncbi:hypothetical protein Dsin_027350 [Dipteronia sinensis]|uniref:Uncharacterized protein n=1 Tax=Dipteronia sinensis TaxID=43782 RepID=A0AAD9ZNR6_9ROSI|nr:hypothetical protein Dsin_027350 [Dipteronia sinensis]
MLSIWGFYCYLQPLFSQTFIMDPANQPRDTWISSSCSASLIVARAAKIAKKRTKAAKIAKKRTRNMFDVDISKPYVKDWILWKMQLRFKCIRDKATWEATREAQNPEIMELISKLTSSNFEVQFECIRDKATKEAQNPEIMELISKLTSSNIGDQDSSLS